MKTVTIQMYQFNDLSDTAKEKVLENFRDINVGFDGWSDDATEDAEEIGRILGIDIENIYFSGFSSQGDGACFEGRYSYRKGSGKELIGYAPKDKELHRIARDIFNLQRRNFYRLEAKVKHSGHYYHKRCTEIDVFNGESG